MNKYKIKPLEWSDPQKSNDEIRYDHVIAETPFGRFLITWKGWKERDCPTIDEAPFDNFYPAGADLDDAKQIAEEEYIKRVGSCIEGDGE